jgi:hypothetical protein
MRIKLTEEQYNRLLVENDKDFLDGDVTFPHIGNKVDKFIVKLFNYIHKKVGHTAEGLGRWGSIVRIIQHDFSLSQSEAILLTYNYNGFSNKNHGVKEGDYSKFLGEPLEFYGDFKFNTQVPVYADIHGMMDGWVTGTATSQDEFIEKLASGDYDDIDSDWNSDVQEDDGVRVEWEIDSDYAYDRISDEIGDLRRDGDIKHIKDRIEIM